MNSFAKISTRMLSCAVAVLILGTCLFVPQAEAYTRDWNANSPIDHTLNALWPTNVRTAKADESERLTDQLYGFTAGETTVGVKALRLIDQVSNPSTVTDTMLIYGKAVSSKTELFLKDEDGNVMQVTSGGNINGVPAGVIAPYGGASAPSGWLLCDGSAVSRTTYSALFTAIGTTFGAGDAVTTFNVPDLRDKHVETKGTTLSSLGATGGATTHTHTGTTAGHALTASEIPPLPLSYGTSTGPGGGTGAAYTLNESPAGTVNLVNSGVTAAGHTHTFTSDAGSSYSPYIVLNSIIKY